MSARTDPLVALSSEGAFIATERPVPLGTPLFLELSAEGEAPGAELDAVAIAGAGPEPGFAVRFVALDEAARRFIAARLSAEERAREPDATLVPQEAEVAAASAPPLDVEIAPPPPAAPSVPVVRPPVAPLELSLDDSAAAPLSAQDLAPIVPEAEAPVRADAIELDDFDAPAAAPEPEPGPAAESQPFDDALELARAVEIEPPAMAAMPPPSPAPAPPAAPAPSTPAARVPLVMPAPLGRDEPRAPSGPAPVPETEQTIKWARASLVPPMTPSGPTRNPFASGDSQSRFPAHEPTERIAPAPAPVAPSPVPPSAADFPDEGPVQTERTERWLRPAPPPAPTPAPTRSELEETRPWTRANLLASAGTAAPPLAAPLPPPRMRTPTSPLTPAAGLPSPTLGIGDSGAVPRAPMPRIASMEVPGSAPASAVDQTQRWPTAKVRVANAPLEMPVGDVPFAQPPEMQEHEGVGAGLDALFGTDEVAGGAEEAFSAPMLERRLEVEPALEQPIEIDESFEPEPIEAAPAAPARAPLAAAPPRGVDETLPLGTRLTAPPVAPLRAADDTLPLATRLPLAPSRPPTLALDDTQPLPAAPAAPTAGLAGFAQQDETAPLPASPPASTAFAAAGGFLGADDDASFGGNAADLFGGVEVTDPGKERAVPATAEDGFEAPDDIGPTLETAEPIEVGEPLELTTLDEEDEGVPLASAPPLPSPPAPAQVAPSFDVRDAEAVVTAEIPAATQERLLQAALPGSPAPAAPAPPTPPAPAPAGAPVQVRTDPFFDRPSAEGVPVPTRPEPRPTETLPYFTLGSLAGSLPPLPPPPPAMTRPPPIPSSPLSRAPSAAPVRAPAATPAPPAPSLPSAPSGSDPMPQRTDPLFPRWSDAAGPTPPPSNPFAGLAPIAPASAAAPLLSNAAPAQAQAAPSEGGDTFFDDLAFEVAEQKGPALPTPGEPWQVQAPEPGPDELPTVLGTDDLPTVVGRAATPSTANPWLVGEPAKKS